MDTIQNYKCPCCGAPLVFDAGSQGLHCESCENKFDLDTIRQLDDAERLSGEESKFDWESYTPRDFTPVNGVDFSNYSCPSCGAEISGDDTMGSTICPYCGNSTIVKGQFEGVLRPDYIIPFKIDKKTAIAAFEADFKKRPFLPDLFRDKKKISEMAGVYVPFWMFDCDCNANLTYRANRTHIWSDSDYIYTKTDFYKLLRSGSLGFENIPVDASKKADDAYMEAIEPFDYSDAMDFDSAYLSGFLADKYDVSVEESILRANARVRNSTLDAFLETTAGFQNVCAERDNISINNSKIRYSLLPVWMLNIKYMDKMYKFAVNGQTGKVVGEYPVDKKKKWKFFAKVAGISLAVTLAIAYFML
ncbi:MAG: hypothetical protein E7473_06445 [Ruminococcaceae bacterium]|nr:hypothetical protein [Oscillospiraceae bacterium]